MDYILKNKDKNVLYFSSKETNNNTTLHDIHIVNDSILPLSMKDKEITKALISWIEKRKIPKGRQFSRNILLTLGEKEKTLMGYIDISFGLSLNDSYWIIPANKDYKWSDYNLYNNEFDKALQLAAFGQRISYHAKSSPEFTTNGMLKKCWHRENGQIFLYKGSSINEASAEHYNYQIAAKLNLFAVPYDIILFNKELVSKCPLFTDENHGYVPIEVFLPKNITVNSPDFEEHCSKIFGQEAFEDMMFFDALIGNIDRHTGNFGMIVNNDTNEILGPAPIFDNGLSLLGSHSKWKNLKEEFYAGASAFNNFFDEQLNTYLRPRHKELLENLVNFKFSKHNLGDINPNLLHEFENLLQENIITILKKNVSPSLTL